MHVVDKTAWEILNATADDCENLEQIYRQVCFELVPQEGKQTSRPAYLFRPLPGALALFEVADRIHDLVKGGLLNILDEEGRPLSPGDDLRSIWRGWFRMTAAGRQLWESSEHLVEKG